MGSIDSVTAALKRDNDSRRAFWPIFQPQDGIRSASPTRVPCSLGYQAMIRKVNGRNHLVLFYLQRSSDFDQFWLSDLWFAKQFQLAVIKSLQADGMEVEEGMLVHYIISLHSFLVEGSEIY